MKTKHPGCCKLASEHIESDSTLTAWEMGMVAMPSEEEQELELNDFVPPYPIVNFVKVVYCPFCGDKLPHPRADLFKKGKND